MNNIPKKIFNQGTDEKFEDAKIIGGNPNGIINYNRTPHQWATSLYKKMLARTWFPDQVNVSKDKVNYSLLTPNEKRMYDLVLAQLIANDSIQTNQLMDSVNRFITSPVVNACLSRQASEESIHCYIEGTEILTSEGFKHFKDITYSDKIANYCYDGSIYFNHPKNIINSFFDGKVISFKMLNYQQIVTPNHKVVKQVPMYATTRSYKHPPGYLLSERADSISVYNYDMPIAGYNIGSNVIFTPLESLAVAFQADGCLVNNQLTPTKFGYCYHYRFKRADKISRMKYLLNLTKLRHIITTNNRGYTHFYIWSPMQFDKTFDWVTLEDKHIYWMYNFLNELQYWDGSFRLEQQLKQKGYGSILYTNSNRKAVDKVIAIAALCGCQTGVHWINPETSKGNNLVDAWQVHIVFGKDSKTGREIKKSSVGYTGSVYCVTSDTGMIVCRYNESVFISGNSDSYAIMAEDIANDTDRIYNMHKVDEELQLKNEAVSEMYNSVSNNLIEITDDTIIMKKPTNEDLLMIFVANQILEELVFPGGFVSILSLESKMPGSAEIITEILKD